MPPTQGGSCHTILCAMNVAVVLGVLCLQYVFLSTPVSVPAGPSQPVVVDVRPSPARRVSQLVHNALEKVHLVDREPTRHWRNDRMAAYAQRLGVELHRPQETIFVALSSYGDRECGPTIARAFKRAVFPDRIFFGVYQQHNCTGAPGNNENFCADCEGQFHRYLNCPDHPACRRQWQIRTTRRHENFTVGHSYGKAMAERHYRNETYVLNMDAHTYLVHGWDSVLIDSWHRLNDRMAVLISEPESYEPAWAGHHLNDSFEIHQMDPVPMACRVRKVPVYKTTALEPVVQMVKRPERPAKTLLVPPHAVMFARGERVSEVPHDPHYMFLEEGEKLVFGARLWTRGFELYNLHLQVAAHLSDNVLRGVMWSRNFGRRALQQYNSTLRANYLLGRPEPSVPADKIDTRGLSRYGLGSVRNAAAFFQQAAIDLNADTDESPSLCEQHSKETKQP